MDAGLDGAPRFRRRRRARVAPFAVAATLAAGVAACGSDDSAGDDDGAGPTVALSADAERGRELAQDNGCRGCHQAGGGGIGPDFEALYGATVTLDDGSTVVADDAYLTLSITDPGAQIVAGFDVRMPARDMSDDDVASIVAYIRELGTEGAGTEGAG
jgi:cytochrome c551/c552